MDIWVGPTFWLQESQPLPSILWGISPEMALLGHMEILLF